MDDAKHPGLNLLRLAQWLPTDFVPDGSSLSATLIAGGRSNLTYAVSDGSKTWIVRRPPVGPLLASAHDMVREYRVMAALQDTDVPVPRTIALCEDESVLGAPFYLMERVPGRAYRYAEEIFPIGPERTRAISESLVDLLAALHKVDPVAVGLAGFGRANGFLERQVRRWQTQFEGARTRDLPLVKQLSARLQSDIPPESTASIVHGDYRLDNVLVDGEDRLTAVLDWELATLGDPLTDLALMLVYARVAELPGSQQIFSVSSAPGYLSEQEILERYARGSQGNVDRFGFYLGLASFKIAGIFEGIHYRYVNGQTVGDGFADVGALVEPTLEAGLDAMKEYP